MIQFYNVPEMLNPWIHKVNIFVLATYPLWLFEIRILSASVLIFYGRLIKLLIIDGSSSSSFCHTACIFIIVLATLFSFVITQLVFCCVMNSELDNWAGQLPGLSERKLEAFPKTTYTDQSKVQRCQEEPSYRDADLIPAQCEGQIITDQRYLLIPGAYG